MDADGWWTNKTKPRPKPIQNKEETDMKQVILTGDRPTGRLHVGHYVGSPQERVRLQNSGQYDNIYIIILNCFEDTSRMERFVL